MRGGLSFFGFFSCYNADNAVLYYIISHNISGGNISITNMTNIIFTYITTIPEVYDINVSAVNILGESLQRYVEGIILK